MSAPCPECGFDLAADSACPVCGYRGSKAASAALTVAPKPRRRPSAATIVTAAGGLLFLIALLLVADPRLTQSADLASAQPAAGIPAPVAATVTAEAAPVGAPPPSAGAPSPAPSPAAAAPVTAAAASAGLVQAEPASVLGLDFPVEQSGAIVLNDGPQPFDIAARGDAPPTTSKAAFVSWMLAHTDQKEKFLAQKWDLAQIVLKTGSITHKRILEAFLRTPREFFARDTRRSYENAVLPIGYGQTISGPLMVSRMTDNLDPQPDQTVLEIGTGSGYQSALLSELCRHVYTVEIVRPLALETDAIYRKHEAAYPEFRNINRKVDDGYYGWVEHAPFDRIIVTCGIDHVPPELLWQLAPEGIMVIPVGPPSGQTILKITKHVEADGIITLEREDIFKGKRKEIFVPFTSRGGGVHGAPTDGNQ